MARYIENSEWKLISSKQINNKTSEYDNGILVETSRVYVHFVYKRRSDGYILTLIAPLVMISILGLLVHLLPADSGEKVSFCITILLTLSVFQLIIAENLPKATQNVPVISK